MKWYFKFFVIAMLVLSVTNLTGCSPRVKSANEVFDDMKANDEFTEEYYEFEIVGVEIEMRQTDIDSKTDIVHANIYLKNIDGSIEGCVYTILTYWLYDKGWVLDTWTVNEDKGIAQFTPITGLNLTEEDIIDVLNGSYSGEKTNISIINSEFLPEENIDKYYVTFTEVHEYVTYQKEIVLSAYFDETTGFWDAQMPEIINVTEEWDISGEYVLEKDYGSYRISNTYTTPQDNMDWSYSYYSNIPYDIDGQTEWWYFENLVNCKTVTFKEFLLQHTGFRYSTQDAFNYRGYKAKFIGDFYGLHEFQYVVTDDGQVPKILYIGPDSIAISTSYVENNYDREYIFELFELEKI